MYAESFGILNPSDIIENAAKWVQWAQAGIMAGASENDATIRYNLNQFWTAKQASYPIADLLDRSQLEKLDVFAHGLWNALETAKIYAASPSYWGFWKAYIGGGIPSRPDAYDAATAAAAAAAGEEAAARRAAATATTPQGQAFGTGMVGMAQQQQRNVAQDVAGAASIWKQAGVDILGVPLWAWGLGAVGLVIVLASRK